MEKPQNPEIVNSEQIPEAVIPATEIAPVKKNHWPVIIVILIVVAGLIFLFGSTALAYMRLYNPFTHKSVVDRIATAIGVPAAVAVPTFTVPTGWSKGYEQAGATYHVIGYVSPDSYPDQGVPVADIQIRIRSVDTDLPEHRITPQTAKEAKSTRDFSEQPISISGVSGTEAEYDSYAFTDSTSMAKHWKNLYVTKNGYNYVIQTSYYKGVGDKYIPDIQKILDTISLP